MTILTVSQLNRYIKAVLEEDRKLADIYLKGEISNFIRHFKSGHFYFSLKDESGIIRAVMFKSHAEDLRFMPENGMSVLVRANVGVYERDGTYQLYVTDLQPDGVGALAMAFEQRKARLAARGLFDERHKKPLPPLPGRIGVVTSQTGAALKDIVNILTRRYPLGTLVVCPAQVQGEAAAESLIKSLRFLDREGCCDVIIIGRGGGSAEDLWAFNDESLAYAVFECKTPVISAVGHETDYTICDFTADLRAPTPSAAAELCAPSSAALERMLRLRGQALAGNAGLMLERYSQRLQYRKENAALKSPMGYIFKNQQRLDFYSQMLYNSKKTNLGRWEKAIFARAERMELLSPLKVLARGYCVALRDGKAVLDASELQIGEEISLRFRESRARARIVEEERL